MVVTGGFVIAIVFLVILFCFKPSLLHWSYKIPNNFGFKKSAKLIQLLVEGLAGCRTWLNIKDIIVSLILGIGAWLIIALNFMYLLDYLAIDIPWRAQLAIYPIAMLAGAVSFLPGGIGTTEAVLTIGLTTHGVEFPLAILVSISIRFVTLWFAIALGFIAIAILEINNQRR